MMTIAHTDREYESELARLRELLLLLGARAESQLASALRAFEQRDPALAQEIIAADLQLDRLEVEADAACMQLLAKRQPVAGDLRFVMTTLKVVTDLERIGDLACNVAGHIIDGIPMGHQDIVRQIHDMGQTVVAMLHDAIDALVDVDAARAAQVISTDERVDTTCADIAIAIASKIAQSPTDVTPLLRLISMARSLERAADHCTNVGEMVVFLAKGHHIRHLRRVGNVDVQ